MSDQQSFARARMAPLCPKHNASMRYFTTKMSERPTATMMADLAVFVCPNVGCLYQIFQKRPTCDACHRLMSLRGAYDERKDVKTYYWRCSKDKLSEEFEPCTDCGGTGWLHMDNRNECGHDPHNERVIGHVCGQFIDRCDGCGHHRFADAIEAERAHRKECGCGHGLPSNSEDCTWVDYGGREGQIYKAMIAAGFSTTITDSSDGEDFRTIEVYIPYDEAYKFIATLDTAWDSVADSKKEIQMKNDEIDEETKNGYRRLSPVEQRVETARNRAVPVLTALINSPVERVSVFSLEDITRSGCVPIRRANEHLLTTDGGHPVVILTKAKMFADVTKSARLEEAYRTLKRETLSLILQLNGMNFQDHPKEEAIRLESRRRALIGALDGLERAEQGLLPNEVSTSTSSARDMVAGLYRERYQMPVAGGYRFEDLERPDDEAVIQGRVYLDGVYYRMVAVEVHEINGVQTPINDPNDWYGEVVGQLNDVNMTTTRITGFTGDYVVCFFPGGQ